MESKEIYIKSNIDSQLQELANIVDIATHAPEDIIEPSLDLLKLKLESFSGLYNDFEFMGAALSKIIDIVDTTNDEYKGIYGALFKFMLKVNQSHRELFGKLQK